MMTMNRATLVGFAGKNPEIRKLPSGDDAAQFSLATTERFRRKDDTVGEATQWHTIVAYGAAAEVVRTRVRKGDPVLVEGRIATRSWEDKAGNERRAIEIVVAGRGGTVNVLTKRRTGGNGDDPPGGAAARNAGGTVATDGADAAHAVAGAAAATGATVGDAGAEAPGATTPSGEATGGTAAAEETPPADGAAMTAGKSSGAGATESAAGDGTATPTNDRAGRGGDAGSVDAGPAAAASQAADPAGDTGVEGQPDDPASHA